jgi:hypothetical protein
MPKFSRPPLTISDLRFDGPPVRLRDVAAITGLSHDTLCRDIASGHLHAWKRRGSRSSPYFIDRDVARHYLAKTMNVKVTVEKSPAAVLMIAERRNVASNR